MEAHVVQVAALQRHILAELDDLGDLVGGQLDTDQFRAARQDLVEAGRRGIENPKMPRPSQTTDWTQTKWSAGFIVPAAALVLRQAFHSSSV
jgi:hypothetical protein